MLFGRRANHRAALLAHPALTDDPEKIPHTGMHHLAFEYADIGDLLDTYDRLSDDGILPHGCLDHGLTTSLYYVDPDGNSVELQADNFGDWAASTEWMRTAPEFEVNPIGVNADQQGNGGTEVRSAGPGGRSARPARRR